MRDQEPPTGISGDAQIPSGAGSLPEVESWSENPLLTHRTVSPVLIVMFCGRFPKSIMLTVCVTFGGRVTVGGGSGAVVVGAAVVGAAVVAGASVVVSICGGSPPGACVLVVVVRSATASASVMVEEVTIVVLVVVEVAEGTGWGVGAGLLTIKATPTADPIASRATTSAGRIVFATERRLTGATGTARVNSAASRDGLKFR